MNDRQTPETDAMIETDAHRIEEYSAPFTAYLRMCGLARTLERERDEWRKKAVDLHSRHKNALEDIEAEMQACEEARDAAEKAKAYKRVMKDENAKLRRELDKAQRDADTFLENFGKTQERAINAERELDELNKRLIEVCQYGVVCTIEREDLRKELAELKEARK